MRFPIAALILSLFTLPSHAVETDPVGAMKVNIAGNGGLSFIGFNFLESAAYSGPVTSVGANSLTATGADFDELLTTGEHYFIDVATGTNAGLNTTITGWSEDTIFIADDLTGLVTTNSDRISIHPLLTIEDVFGTGGDVLEGGSATTADLIFMPNPDGDGLVTVYYSNGGLVGSGWRIVGEGTSPGGDTPIYYSDGLYVYKKSAGDAELLISGAVKMSPSVVVIPEGFTPLNTIYPAGTTFSTSGLYNASNPSDPNNILAGSATTADLIFTDTDGDGHMETYYYSSGGLVGSGWRKVGEGSTPMDTRGFGDGFGILRRGDTLESQRPVSFLQEQ